ncbi:hypothetical protein LCGC14_0474430 [marine sediment metagenome]|uniref:Uncharacterized protein n=1 Tax=marine sediment metagenome TaxID=412755 RepID=A0A0F9VJX8_9ZZZZ
MKDKLARRDTELLRIEVQEDYRSQSERLGQLQRDHQRLLEYLGLELKRNPVTVTYVKRRKK